MMTTKYLDCGRHGYAYVFNKVFCAYAYELTHGTGYGTGLVQFFTMAVFVRIALLTFLYFVFVLRCI